MKFFRRYLEIAFTLCILALFVGCASPMNQANKLAMSDPESAIPVYEQIIASNPGSPEAQQAHLGIAKTYYERIEDEQKGLEVYEEVVSKYPKTEAAGKANYAIAWHYFNAKDYDEARKRFAIVTKEMPGTEEASGAALAIAKSYEELKKYDEAAKLYKEFSATHPKHRYAAQAGLSAARSYKRAGKNDEAVEAYKAVVKDYSFSSSGKEALDTLDNMGVDTSELIQIPEAERMPVQPESVSRIGVARNRRARNAPRDAFGRVPEGGRPKADAAGISPDFGVNPTELMPPGLSGDSQGTMYDAMYMIANMSLQSREYKNAGALYERAIQSAGNKSWKSAPSAYFGLAKSYKGIGNDEKAAEMFKKAISLDRKIIDRMITTGETQYGDEEYEDALKSYKLALGLAPHKDSDIYYDMGLVYKEMWLAHKKKGGADNELEAFADSELDAFERAVALKPNFTDAVQHLAEVLNYRKKNAVRAILYDSEARGQGNTDYKIQAELGDLSYRYGAIFSKEADRARQTSSAYSWSKIKYGNAARLIKKEIEDELKDAIALSNSSAIGSMAPKEGFDLGLGDWYWSTIDGGYVKAEGQVKNISGRSLRNVEAVVTFYDEKNGFITYSSALIEFNPILSGQTSPFSVMEKRNPAMRIAGIEFKFLGGEKIFTYQKSQIEKSETPKTKGTLKSVSKKAASGDEQALEALRKVAPLLAEYRYIGSRIVICHVRMNREKDAQKRIDKMKGDDPGVADSADFHLALGELALLQGNKEAGLAEINKAIEMDPERKEAAQRLKEVEAQEAAPVEAAE